MKTRHIVRHGTLPVLLVSCLAAGCAGLRPPAVPAEPPADAAGAGAASRAGFEAVYEGRLEIGFRSFQSIWYVAVAPGGTSVSAAVLSPVGVKIMELHGAPTGHTSTVFVPGAERLAPYGDVLWDALYWGLADDVTCGPVAWTRTGDVVTGNAARDGLDVNVQANPTTGTLLGKEVRAGRRTQHDIRYGDERREGGRTYWGHLTIECGRPHCHLDLTLKRLRWIDRPQGAGDATGP